MDRPHLISLIASGDQQVIDQFFEIGDKDLNGALSQDEFRQVAELLGYSGVMNQFFPSMDANKDGLVTKAEMTAFIQ
jgi:hypothetical protein